MSDNLHKTGVGIDDEKNGLPPLDDMYKPPKNDDMGFSQPGSGLPPLNPGKDDMRSRNSAPYYADGSIPPFYGQANNAPQGNVSPQYGQPNNMPQGNVSPQYGQPNNMPQGNVPPQYGQPNNMPQGNVPPQYGQQYNVPQGNIPPQYIQAYPTRTFSEHDMLAEEGRKIAKVVGIIEIVLAALALFTKFLNFISDTGNIQIASEMMRVAVSSILNIYIAICFMKGGNKSRIYFGVCSVIEVLAMIGILVILIAGTGALFGAEVAAVLSLGLGVILIVMMPAIALSVFIIWATLISKKVRAYCGALR